MRRDIEFKSNGELCRGWLITPDEGEGPFPTIVMAGGWCYVKEIVMPDYAEFVVREGCAVIIFDYRNFAKSEGKIRQHLDPWWQIEDYRSAISFAETLPEVDSERIGIWGISYSGGHVLIVGAIDPRVKLIISTIPVVDGYANMEKVHGAVAFEKLQDLILEDRRKRFKNEEDRGIMCMSPDEDSNAEVCAWPFTSVKKIFMDHKNRVAHLHEHFNTIESVEMLLQYTVFPFVPKILNTPTHMSVAEGDNITCWDLEIEAFRQIRSAKKELFVVPLTTHMSLYSDKSRLDMVGTQQGEFVRKWLVEPYKKA